MAETNQKINDEVIPRAAVASLILWGDKDPEILLVRRSDKLRFMPGHHAFPGGRIDDDETNFAVVGAESEAEGRAYHAMVREILEETGLLCVSGKLPPITEIREAREKLLNGENALDPLLKKHSLKIQAKDFDKAGRWITPKFVPIRFDTQYYLYRLQGDKYEELIEGELSDLEWLQPKEARKKWQLGEIEMSPPVAFAVRQVAFYDYPEVLEKLSKTPHLESAAEPVRLEWRRGVSVIPLKTRTMWPATHTNCVVLGESELFVIDPGPYSDEDKQILRAQLDEMLINGGKIKAVLLTHSHGDHVAAAEFIREQYGAPIWGHADMQERLKFTLDRTIEDNEVLELAGDPGWKVRCLYTPGHDPGHLSYMEESTRTLMVGDMLANGSSIIVSPRIGGNMNQYMESLDRLLELDMDLMIPAHGRNFTDPKKKIRDYISHRLEREAKVKKAMDSGLRTVKEMIPVVYSDTPKAMWPYAEEALRAHMIRLGVTPTD